MANVHSVSADDNEAFLMVNVRARSSGLKNNIWIGPRGGARHGPRIKVQTDHRAAFDLTKLAVVAIDGELIEGELSAADLAQVRRYLVRNRTAILDHWEERTDGIELGRALKSLA